MDCFALSSGVQASKMVAASLTKSVISAPVVAQTAARVPRAAAAARPMGKAALLAKTERTFSQAVAGRVATVQVR